MIPAALLAGLLAGLVIKAWWPIIPVTIVWLVLTLPLQTAQAPVIATLLLEGGANVALGVIAGRGARLLLTEAGRSLH